MAGMSNATRVAIMKSLSSRRLCTSDYWEYAVSMSWLESWDICISQSFSLEHDKDVIGKVISKPVTMSKDDEKNVYIPESQWEIYLALFGIADDHERRRRPIYSLYACIDPDRNPYTDNVMTDKELDFLQILVTGVNDITAVNEIKKQISVFAWDSLMYIGKQAKSLLGVKANMKVRLWLYIFPKDRDAVIEPIMEEKQTLLCKLTEIMPPIKNILKKRSNQMNDKYIVSDMKAKIERRKPLMEDLLEYFHVPSAFIAIAIEQLGPKIYHPSLEKVTNAGDLETNSLESIVTISSIQNEWEDVLTSFVEKYTDDMLGNTEALKQKLVDSAKCIVGEKMREISEIRSDLEKRFFLIEERENVVREKENDINETEMSIAEKLSQIKQEYAVLQQEKTKLSDEIERMEFQNKLSETRVTLNVGGIMYATSTETLTKKKGSLLAMMFGGRHALKMERDGTYFIDRDGVNFRYILNYLRDGADSVEALPKEQKLIKELKIEAKYYSLVELENLLENLL
ncbi:uncharacterized protein LOC132757155 [Ruditapes philippinarum]|uniref:uncharacterized protein LOC132757155 n=1 Tax=Ruditapes philippinarum TaxID=129788 RepID=UPI00295AB496|nr:uncharacterized protein LOC132757155 [Ruditapes philippinarum]